VGAPPRPKAGSGPVGAASVGVRGVQRGRRRHPARRHTGGRTRPLKRGSDGCCLDLGATWCRDSGFAPAAGNRVIEADRQARRLFESLATFYRNGQVSALGGTRQAVRGPGDPSDGDGRGPARARSKVTVELCPDSGRFDRHAGRGLFVNGNVRTGPRVRPLITRPSAGSGERSGSLGPAAVDCGCAGVVVRTGVNGCVVGVSGYGAVLALRRCVRRCRVCGRRCRAVPAVPRRVRGSRRRRWCGCGAVARPGGLGRAVRIGRW
jgi:hypothetical protein